MCQPRLRFQLAQFRPRQTLRHEPHRNLISVKTERLRQRFMQRLRGTGQPLPANTSAALSAQAEEPCGAQDVGNLAGG